MRRIFADRTTTPVSGAHGMYTKTPHRGLHATSAYADFVANLDKAVQRIREILYSGLDNPLVTITDKTPKQTKRNREICARLRKESSKSIVAASPLKAHSVSEIYPAPFYLWLTAIEFAFNRLRAIIRGTNIMHRVSLCERRVSPGSGIAVCLYTLSSS